MSETTRVLTAREKEIEELQERIYNLQEEEQAENRLAVLPFLQENCILIWCNSCSLEVECPNTEIEKKLISVIQGKQDGGYNHFGCDVAPSVSIRYDDGRITLSVFVAGKIEEVRKAAILKAKELKLTISFSYSIEQHRSTIARAQKSISDIEALQKLYAE